MDGRQTVTLRFPLDAAGVMMHCFDAVIGCGTPPAPAGGWVRRHGDKLTLGCNYSVGLTWSLTCVDSRWIGNTHNCTIPGILIVVVTFYQPRID